MDLTKLSDKDLMALQGGDFTKLSNEGLQQLHGQSNPQPNAQKPTDKPSGFVNGLKNFGLGALKGATDIGATLLSPIDATGILGMTPSERKQSLSSFYTENADTKSLPFSAGALTSSIAGTAGAGGLLARPLIAGASKLGAIAPYAVKLAEALKSGGLSLGGGGGNAVANGVTRVAGGATSAALGSALLDPTLDSIKTGALVGGAIPILGKAAPLVGGLAADLIGGIGTHTGGESLRTAARAGMQGGDNAQSFVNNMRGNVPMTDVLDAAKSNLNQMRLDKVADYKSGMQGISSHKTILDFAPIANELKTQASVGSYKGKVINESTADTQQKIKSLIDDWGSSNPAEYHTPEGFDALKKAVGDIRESTPFATPSRKVADSVYNSVKNEITKQSPDYAKTMQGYSEASAQISEIEKALSLGNKASVDTAMRKLQSLTRNNVNTNYGNRLDLAKALESQGGQEIMPALAGQSLSSMTPRGLGGAVAGATGVTGLATMNPALIGSLLLQSPRLMGETALKAGQASKFISNSASKITPSTAALINALRSD